MGKGMNLLPENRKRGYFQEGRKEGRKEGILSLWSLFIFLLLF